VVLLLRLVRIQINYGDVDSLVLGRVILRKYPQVMTHEPDIPKPTSEMVCHPLLLLPRLVAEAFEGRSDPEDLVQDTGLRASNSTWGPMSAPSGADRTQPVPFWATEHCSGCTTEF